MKYNNVESTKSSFKCTNNSGIFFVSKQSVIIQLQKRLSKIDLDAIILINLTAINFLLTGIFSHYCLVNHLPQKMKTNCKRLIFLIAHLFIGFYFHFHLLPIRKFPAIFRLKQYYAIVCIRLLKLHLLHLVEFISSIICGYFNR